MQRLVLAGPSDERSGVLAKAPKTAKAPPAKAPESRESGDSEEAVIQGETTVDPAAQLQAMDMRIRGSSLVFSVLKTNSKLPQVRIQICNDGLDSDQPKLMDSRGHSYKWHAEPARPELRGMTFLPFIQTRQTQTDGEEVGSIDRKAVEVD